MRILSTNIQNERGRAADARVDALTCPGNDENQKHTKSRCGFLKISRIRNGSSLSFFRKKLCDN
ncbi:hypothetical protein KDAU_62560 [Dictyobacter aurantiacus]|uniref:Uncharacterized protein n=1 Tax=Dictyobacter aurantiacus TaxID=1936993 RepID=A0A401ZPY3_9CHLR|nr:hypothetical protein KDAU_62560 [Dictyobacter aurantiacus]